MQGLMQRRELAIPSIISHAARHHGGTEVVSRREDGRVVRTAYAEIDRRSRRVAAMLGELGIGFGDRVATLAMNSDRHLELYYGIAGVGAVCNTVNPRLSIDDIAYILDHAEDGLVFVDPCFVPIVEAVVPRLGATLRGVVVLADEGALPPCALPPGVPLHGYEALMARVAELPVWPTVDEESAAGLCYTSGTTGRPKGVLYSHRSTILHAMAMNFADCLALRATDRLMPIVPMFHVNAWGLPFIAPMAGAAMVMPGRQMDPASLVELLNAERVTVSVGVPTIWLAILDHLRRTGTRLTSLRRLFSGGSAFPRALIVDYAALGVEVTHAWGMTESSPVASVNAPKTTCLSLDAEARLDQRAKQGRTVFGADVRPETEGGAEAPWDGRTPGNITMRGHWVARGYYRQPETEVGPDGWFPTGDVGVVDADGFMTLTDRTKDLIKSGGEWISSIALENIAMGHPDVAEAAAIAVPHDLWGERPLLIVVPRMGHAPVAEDLLGFFAGKVPSWSVPDRVVIAPSLPHGATGKVLKTELRRLYAGGAPAAV